MVKKLSHRDSSDELHKESGNNPISDDVGKRTELRAWVLPEEPITVRFMNTIWADKNGLHDDLGFPLDLYDWLGAISSDYKIEAVTGEEHARARQLRDSLRKLAAFITEDTRLAAASPIQDVAEAIRRVNDVAADLPREKLIQLNGKLMRAEDSNASPTSAALATIANDAIDLFTGPKASRLRACQAPGCVLYYFKSHARREWCSEACGNRVRAARHYERVRTHASSRDS